MKKPKKLTDADIRKLKVEPGKPDAFIFDPSEPGFGARKYASGRVTLFALCPCNMTREQAGVRFLTEPRN